ncbi:MAG: hypothetical protein NTW49_06025 [Bacteroidia bacterium]|nr:hypothetical protein [Bacteroidia bacterium]
MKKIMLTFAIITSFIATIISASYGQEPDKNSVKARENLKEAKKGVVDAKQDLKQAQKDSVAEYQNFKKESQDKLTANEKSIAKFKARIAKEKKENRAKYEKKLAELDQKNSDLKKKLDEYKEDGKIKWANFKSDFNNDMDGLGKALKNFTITDKKRH